MYRLVVTYDEQTDRHPLPRSGEVSLGSAPENDIVIPARGVSRRHALLRLSGLRVEIEDLGSKNRIVRAGHRMQSLELRANSVFQLGVAQLRIEEISTSDAAIALALPSPSPPPRIAGPDKDTPQVEGDSGSATSAAALNWATRWHRVAPHELAAGVEEARRALGATSIVLIRSRRREAVVVAGSGPFPRVSEIGRLHEAARTEAVTHAGSWTIARANAVTAAALLPRTAAAWQRSFLLLLAALFDGEPVVRAGTSEPSTLQLPEAFVVGPSTVMDKVLRELATIARTTADVLLLGKSGTGKELLARAIHETSPRRSGPFVAVNCASFPQELLESELFGVERGTATGVDAREGLFRTAHGGTIFLDEIGDAHLMTQAKLLRVLEERELLPLGGRAPVKVDVRVVSATNKNIEASVAAGTLREDFAYRLGLRVKLPTLAERREDLPALIHALTSRLAKEHGCRIEGVSEKALRRLLAYDWPGNVRQLRSVLERAVLLTDDGGALEFASLVELRDEPLAAPHEEDGTLETLERVRISEALAAADGNVSAAAKQLGVTRAGLYKMLRRLGIDNRFRAES